MMMHEKRGLFQLPVLIFFVLIGIELSLEYRAHGRGFRTLLFSESQENEKLGVEPLNGGYGPTQQFPFYSKLLPRNEKNNAIRIWIASASHALAGAPIEKIFPNILCGELNLDERHCQVLNGSEIGEVIRGNVSKLGELAGQYTPDYILLYGLTQDINWSARGGENTRGALSTNGIIDYQWLHWLFENTAVYGHLRTYVSGLMLLQAPLDEILSGEEFARIEDDINDFIDVSLETGATPILTTFATSHDGGEQRKSTYPISVDLHLMRYQQSLSPNGWRNSIIYMNRRIIEIGKKRNIDVIDLAKKLSGRQELFVDFVHFNESGHEEVALVIGQYFQSKIDENFKHGI